MTRRDRRGSLLPAMLVFVVAAGYATLEAGTFWEAVLRREREDQLAWALAHLQAAVDESAHRLGHAPQTMGEVAALEPPVLPRLPLDPLTGRADWTLSNGEVHAGADDEAFDGTRMGAWHAVRKGRTWRIDRGEPK